MKRNFGIRASAIFVLLWYCLGIIGFNVHTCNASNNSFIVTFLEDMSCDAIHPSDNCASTTSCCCCCGHHTCCSSTYNDNIVHNQILNFHKCTKLSLDYCAFRLRNRCFWIKNYYFCINNHIQKTIIKI